LVALLPYGLDEIAVNRFNLSQTFVVVRPPPAPFVMAKPLTSSELGA
jgi:hypothetical protein